MSERVQKTLWILLAVVAVGLSAATAYLFALSRRMSSGEPNYRIAYTSFTEESSQIYSCDLLGMNVTQLTDSDFRHAFAVSEPWLPKGANTHRIAFLRLQPSTGSTESGVGARGGVYVMNALGGEPTKVSGSLERVWTVAPSWSPDGKQLVFGAVEDLNNDGQLRLEDLGVYVADVESGEPKLVITIGAALTRLSWSPADPLVILTMIESNELESKLLDIQTGQIVLEGPVPAACWSPDGVELATYWTKDRRIHILHPDGTESYELDPPPGEVAELLWASAWPPGAQSEAGTLLAIASPQHGSHVGQIYMRPAEPGAGRWERLSGPHDYAMHVAVSPDGHYLAYASYAGGPRRAAPYPDIFLLDLGSGQASRLTSEAGFEGQPTWLTLEAK